MGCQTGQLTHVRAATQTHGGDELTWAQVHWLSSGASEVEQSKSGSGGCETATEATAESMLPTNKESIARFEGKRVSG